MKSLTTSALSMGLAFSGLLAITPVVGAESSQSPAAALPVVDFRPGPERSDAARMWQGISGLERSPGGRLWATWYAGGVGEDQHNYVVLVTSGDDGKSWSDLKLVIDPDGDGPVRAFDPVPWVDPSGKLWLFWCQATKGGAGDPFTFAITTENPNDQNPPIRTNSPHPNPVRMRIRSKMDQAVPRTTSSSTSQ